MQPGGNSVGVRSLLQNIRYPAPVGNPEKEIYFGNLGRQLGPVALRQAAADREDLAIAVLLVAGQFENGFDRLFDRGLDEGTGVDDDDPGRGRVVNQFKSGVVEKVDQPFGINFILGTT